VKSLVENLELVCSALREARGEIALAALLMPEETAGRWDFVIAAPWLSGGLADYELVARMLTRFLNREQLAQISRTVIIPTRDQWSFAGLEMPLRSGEVRNFTFNGERIKKGYILVSNIIAPITHPARKNGKGRATAGPTHLQRKRRFADQRQ
jgi:hypothetical protein